MSVSWEDLKRSIKEVVKEELNNEPQSQESSHVDHACSCPDCYCDIIERMNKTSDYVCRHCGLPLGDEEFVKKLNHCPNCGGKRAKKVER